MPDRSCLKVGDAIRLLQVPKGDLEQRDRQQRRGDGDAGWTANTIEQILAQNPIVEISWIDEYGYPWFEYHLLCRGGKVEHHALAIMEDESWCLA